MNMKVNFRLAIAMLVLVLGITVGCNKAPSDAQVTSDIQNKLTADSGLQGKQLGVAVENGTVTLSGAVDNDAERDAAARYASSVAGVKQVVNNLTVTPAIAEVPPPPAPVEEPKPKPARAEKPRASKPRTHTATPPPPPENNGPTDNSNMAMTAPT